MKIKLSRDITAFSLLLIIIFFPVFGYGWHNKTHLSIAKAAGYKDWFNAAGADMMKIKAICGNRNIEQPNHYYSNPKEKNIDAEMVLNQAERYNDPLDKKGHLYGAIIASLREYHKVRRTGKYGEYHLSFCAHYAGDLSMPFHNTEYKGFAEKNHTKVDAVVENEVWDNRGRIRIYSITITTEKELASEIARIANISSKLGYKLVEEKRLLTKKEAYEQLSHSASLFKAILNYVNLHH
ncbi:MAG: hypothetical protein R6X10_07110 [Desulfobacterales bacterium]